MNRKINWDALGIVTSVACAIHCAVLPLVLASLPVFGVDLIENTRFEYGMIGLAFGIGCWSLWHGHRKHRNPRFTGYWHRFRPWILFSTGMLFLLAKQIWHQYQLWLLPLALLLIISAHLINFRAIRLHPHASAPAAAPPVSGMTASPGE